MLGVARERSLETDELRSGLSRARWTSADNETLLITSRTVFLAIARLFQLESCYMKIINSEGEMGSMREVIAV